MAGSVSLPDLIKAIRGQVHNPRPTASLWPSLDPHRKEQTQPPLSLSDTTYEWSNDYAGNKHAYCNTYRDLSDIIVDGVMAGQFSCS